MELSDKQKDIIDAPVGNILVSAAAGSGKTTVLVNRIITKICEGIFDVDDLLVVTFTREAASNMCDKIEKAIKTKIEEIRVNGGDRELRAKLEDQLDKLPNAYIQTIDSFCSRVVKEKGYVLSGSGKDRLLEPGNTVLDGNELDIILSEAAASAISEGYAPDNINDRFEALTRMFGNGRTDDSLASSMVITYKKLRSLPDYIDRINGLIDAAQKGCDEGKIAGLRRFVDTVITLYSKIDDRLIDRLDGMVDEIEFLKSKNEVRQEMWHELLSLIRRYVSRVLAVASEGDDVKTFEAIVDVQDISDEANPGVYNDIPKADEDDDLIREFTEDYSPIAAMVLFLKPLILGSKRIKNRYKESAGVLILKEEYTAIIKRGSQDLLGLQKARLELAREYVKLIVRMDSLYEEFKSVVHGMDFPDQEHLALEVLKNDEARAFYRKKFKEIYIDEYQDNSELQDKIVEQIENGNVFRVGDVKQSIYKFRYAEPSLFLKLYDRYHSGDGGTLKLLNNNYRSDRHILEFVNQIFYRIMNREGAEIDYDEDQALNPPDHQERGTDIPDKDADKVPHVTIVNKDKGISSVSCMNEGVLKEVRRYTEDGYKTSDICILTRKRRTAAAITEFLNENGFASRYADDIGVFADNEIHGITNIIISAGNELRDEYLIGILLSGYRISNFTLDEIARIYLFAKERHMRKEPLISKLRIFASEASAEDEGELYDRINIFLDWFDALRNDLIITDIGEFIDRVYKDTCIGASSDDPEKFIIFKQWLCSNFMRYGSDIATIASRLEKMKINAGDRASVKREDNSDGKIRCMTYHSSKGLEFPCVIVTELYTRNEEDKTGPVKFDPEYGTVLNDFDEESFKIPLSIERVFLDEDNKLAENAEGMRLLYVALTRAEHELSVVYPLEAIDSPKMTGLYKLIRRQTETGCTRAHWLSRPGIDMAFLSALLSFSGAKELRELMSPDGDTHIAREVDFDGFTLDIMSLVFQLEDNDASDLGDLSENTGEDESYGSELDDQDSGSGRLSGNNDSVSSSINDKKTTGIIPVCAESFDDTGMPVFAPYPYEEATDIPFKISVSQIVRHGVSASLPINLEVQRLEHYLDVRDGIIDDSASAVGTFVHRIFRFIDLEKAAEDAEGQIDLLIDEEIISVADKDKAIEFKEGIASFAVSDIGRKLIAADKTDNAEYEKPIVFSVPASGGDSVLVQGVIDCMFKGDDGCYTIIDYKTDRFPENVTEDEMITETIRRHKTQIMCYSAAVESSGKDVGEKYIYLVRYGKFVKI